MRIVRGEIFIIIVLFRTIESSSQPDSLSPTSSPRRERSRSPIVSYQDPSTRLPFSEVLGYRFDELQFIRLTPVKNLHRRFELRKYTFDVNNRIKLLERHNFFPPVPPQEQIVLSTFDGDAFAILWSSNYLAGLFKYFHNNKAYKRIKINIESGRIDQLTPGEVKEVPVGDFRRIQYNFRVERVNHDDGPPFSVEPGISSSRNSHHSLPFSNILGYGIHQLQSIRLCYKGNPHRLFDLRRYTFPSNKPIKILTEENHYKLIPIQEQIVLSTVGGDVFAILESSNVLAGIYAHDPHTHSEKRAKINMRSSRITLLTSDEIREVPVGTRREIRLYYIVDLINSNPSYD